MASRPATGSIRGLVAAAVLWSFLASCGGSGGSTGGAPPPGGSTGGGGGTGAGPPLPEIVDESGVPESSGADRIAFTGATVVTLAAAGVLESTTVVVEGGRIAAIVPDSGFTAAPGTELVDANGRWLLPGLVDSHVHMVTNGEDDLMLYLAAGVTAVRVMWGNDVYLGWREEIAAGTREGPRLYVASPGVDGPGAFWPGSIVASNEVEARMAVDDLAARGFDAIKVYNNLGSSAYVAIANEAESIGIPFVGHVPFAVGAEAALADGRIRSIEHFTRFVSEVTTGNSWGTPLDEDGANAIAESLFLAGTWNVPTLVVQLRTADQVPALEAHPVMDWVSPGMRAFLRDPSTQPPAAGAASDPASRLALVRLLHERGVRLAIGTDTGIRYVFPGFSVHEELRNFVAAGLSPEAAIRAATVSAWALLGAAGEGGTVEVGKRADLLLLAADPLADVDNLLRRVGVMASGRWYAQSRLMSLVQE